MSFEECVDEGERVLVDLPDQASRGIAGGADVTYAIGVLDENLVVVVRRFPDEAAREKSRVDLAFVEYVRHADWAIFTVDVSD